MGLYNQLFGVNEIAPLLTTMLNLDFEDFGRFRDAYLDKTGDKIFVYTRCGGKNRESHEHVFEKMKAHPNFIKDYDDSFDNTYCYFEFSMPDEEKEFVRRSKLVEKFGQEKTPTEKFKIALDDLKSGKDNESTKKAKDFAKNLLDQIQAGREGEGGIKIIRI